MGSAFYTFDEAAARLGCSKRTVHNHIKRGYLVRVIQGGKVVLRKNEVEQLAGSSGTDLPAMNRQSFFLLMNRVQKLEHIVGVLQRALDIRDSPLRPGKEEAIQLYQAAVNFLTINHWTDKEVERWSTLFDRMDDVTLEAICEAVASNTAYEPFFKLCTKFMKDLYNRKEFETNLELQYLHMKLEAGRKALKESILIRMTVSKGMVPESLLEKLDTEKNSLFKRLTGGERAKA